MARPVKTVYKPQNPEKYKGKHEIVCRSSWEKALCVWCDRNPNVIEWASEEVVIPYRWGNENKVRRYYPDFLIKLKDKNGNTRTLLIEVKPYKETQEPVSKKGKRKKTLLQEQLTYSKNTSKWEAAQAFCRKNNIEFHIWTEDHLHAIGVKVAPRKKRR